MKVAHFAIASFVAVGAALAGEGDALSENRQADIRAPGGTGQEGTVLQRLALALSYGRDAMESLHGPPSQSEVDKDKLNASIDGMHCYIDRNANYISCYSSPIDFQQAETLFAKVNQELQAALPFQQWKGSEQEAGSPSVRSYAYNDLQSNAHIDVGIVTWAGLTGGISYIVSIFGWPD